MIDNATGEVVTGEPTKKRQTRAAQAVKDAVKQPEPTTEQTPRSDVVDADFTDETEDSASDPVEGELTEEEIPM